eukprot:CAMPEP_0197589706 /NCGR_PEP_ID=MMETSP1326-20131121/10563_1 /TAXON_ID=1155430 /ORGANISM="Genus nov. species nov., Strain RCC2288" /LENGTH=52 /DNA_ID=CAMNT_0043154675 /DNA_START=32 /DNA_END=187 /DNA_ORIENTATION=-
MYPSQGWSRIASIDQHQLTTVGGCGFLRYQSSFTQSVGRRRAHEEEEEHKKK